MVAIANKIVEVRRALDAFNYKRKQHLSRTVETTLQEIEQAFGNKSYTEAEHLIEVIHILIAREARRSGIGTKLLDAITQDLGPASWEFSFRQQMSLVKLFSAT